MKTVNAPRQNLATQKAPTPHHSPDHVQTLTSVLKEEAEVHQDHLRRTAQENVFLPSVWTPPVFTTKYLPHGHDPVRFGSNKITLRGEVLFAPILMNVQRQDSTTLRIGKFLLKTWNSMPVTGVPDLTVQTIQTATIQVVGFEDLADIIAQQISEKDLIEVYGTLKTSSSETTSEMDGVAPKKTYYTQLTCKTITKFVAP